MKNFSQIINEERVRYDSVSLLQSEITSYINKVNKILPKNIQDLLRYTEQLNLGSSDDLDLIKNSNKSQVKSIADKLNITPEQVETVKALLKQAGRNIRLLPQYQSATERAAVEAGKLAVNDLTIDLETQTGRNAAAKMYTPLVLKIVNQYIGKSRLDKPSLISAGMAGLAAAMKDWKRDGVPGGKKTTFKTYAGYRIQQAILDDINANGHTLSGGNWYNTQQYGAAAFDAVSIDGFKANDNDDDFSKDHLAELGTTGDIKDYSKEESSWKEVFELMEKQFSTRDVDIFYRYFGLGPYKGKRQKSKDIAKEYGMSEGNIKNSIINKVIKFLQTNPKAVELMSDLKDMYTESLLADMINYDKEVIKESLYNDSTYIMLEEVTRWNNKQTVEQAVLAACDKVSIEEAKIILDCILGGRETFNKLFKRNRKLITYFLSEVYPMENMRRKSDNELADFMNELTEATKYFKIDW